MSGSCPSLARFQSGSKGGNVGFVGSGSGAGTIDQCLEAIERLQQKVGDGDRHDHLTAAQLIQHRFHLVRELGDGGEPEHAAVALDGMGPAKNAVQQVDVSRALFELEQSFLNRRQVFLGLFEKGVFEV
ncbi:MAG: hypothetical protein IPI70_15965 [Nitrospira sp.]|nr:hypothetical protein [Nitrospira sp.]